MFNDLILVGVNSSGPRTCTFYFLTEHDVSKRRFPTKKTPFAYLQDDPNVHVQWSTSLLSL